MNVSRSLAHALRAPTPRLAAAIAIAIALAALNLPAATPAAPPDPLFDSPRVLSLALNLAPAAVDYLKRYPGDYVKAQLQEGSQTYDNIGVRIRGKRKFLSLNEGPSLVVKFNEFNSGARFHTHSRIFLGNAEDDPSYLKKAIGGELFRTVGVPAPKIAFARLTVNGTDLGLYLVEQAVNRELLADYFESTKGNLYEGSDADIDQELEKDSGGSTKDQADLRALAAAARLTDPAARWEQLQARLDLDRFASFLATEVFTSHTKGYSMDVNNYRVYHDPLTEKIIFIPHDLDGIFRQADLPLLPTWKGLVARALLDLPQGRQAYFDALTRLSQITAPDTPWDQRVSTLARQLRPLLPRDPPTLRQFDTAVAQLRQQIAERTRFVAAELPKLSR